MRSETSKGVVPFNDRKGETRRNYNVFVSHAGPDKFKLAQPLHHALQRLRLESFFDVKELAYSRMTAPEQMEKAMEDASIGIFVLTPEFAARRWTMKELRTFIERTKVEDEQSKPVLVPVFYELTPSECCNVYDEGSAHQETLRKARFFDQWRQEECSTNEAKEALWILARSWGTERTPLGQGEGRSTAAVVDDIFQNITDYLQREDVVPDPRPL